MNEQAKFFTFHEGTFDAPHYTYGAGYFAPWADLTVFELAELEAEVNLVKLKIARQRARLEEAQA
jgi:hypothetical protein